MKLVRFDSMMFVVGDEDPISTAMSANLEFLREWKDNPFDERYPQYVEWAKDPNNYTVEDLDLDTLDSLIRCVRMLYMGRYGNALVFNE